ncbi:hypothetical protein POM88_033226 [Heracleum sosnowskyi]|uniref:Myb-like domain-containing protein n=1 Tax=Heracleum sosnowskyi TaxID=360622 RepID=A0AAD8I1P8_9APIA|nr:hypothetical protein POM88_033226 [Heracleum sosnowskyi]
MMDENVPIKKFHWMDFCIKCDKSNGKLLTCHENDCPLVVHEDCLGFEAKFDYVGNFYCPYCVFKRASQEVIEAERKAVVAEKTLSTFLHGNGEVDVEVVETENVTGSSTDVRNQGVERGTECSMRDEGAEVFLVNNEGVVLLHRVGDDGGLNDDLNRVKVAEKGSDECCSGEGKVDQQRDVDMTERSQSGDKIQNDVTRTETFSKNHQDAGHYDSRDFMEENAEEAEENEGRVDEVKNQEQAQKTKEKALCKESVPQVQKEAKRKVNDTTASTCMDTDTTSDEVTGAQPPGVDTPKGSSRKSSKVAKPPAIFRKLPTSTVKRKRAAWKVEEENQLKEGVKKHKEIVNKNIPWKKILEEGSDVFDESRTPADLKDKWRNILAKEPLFELS